MLRYIANRLLAALVTFLLVITLTFFLMQAVPGNPFLGDDNPRPEVAEMMMKKYGLDQPVIVQFKNYVVNLLHGDLGISIKMRWGEDVTSIIASRVPVSAQVGFIAFLLAIGIGIPMGTLAALRTGRFTDRVIIVLCAFGVSVPNFVLATVLMYVLGVQLKLLPFMGLPNWQSFVMPVACLCLRPISFISRLTRSNMLDALSQDYIKTARAKGLKEGAVLFKHALRNALIPVVTYIGPQFVGILTGSFVIEKIFTIPGLSRYFVDSISGRDYPVIMGTTIFFGFFLIAVNFIVDMMYGVIDPRIKTQKKQSYSQ